MASDDDIMSFDEYCFDVLDITDTDFLSRAEWDKYYELYENYLKRELKDDFDTLVQ
jgi:hypothetical protein